MTLEVFTNVNDLDMCNSGDVSDELNWVHVFVINNDVFK